MLRRDLGFWDAVGVGLGAIIGAGIFVVIGVAAGMAGPSLILGLAVAAGVAMCNALSSAELAARYPSSGGTYEYGYELLSPWAGFAAGWMFLASKLAAGGTVALGFGHYLAALLPGVDARIAGVLAVAGLTFANLFGIRKVGVLNLLIVAVTVSVLIAFVVIGMPHVRPENLRPIEPSAILPSAALLFFSYTGYARIATLAEEVREPERTIPRAIVASLLIAVVLYGLVAWVAVGTVGASELATSSAPLQTAALSFSGQSLGTVLIVGATTAMLGVLLSQVLGISRMMLAMARRRDLPAVLDRVSDRHAVPGYAIATTGVIIALLAAFGSLGFVAAAASFTILLYYTMTNMAALRLPKRNKRFPAFIAWAGLLSCLGLAASLSLEVIAAGSAVLALGLVLRMMFQRFSKP